jgi:hypothetical protein
MQLPRLSSKIAFSLLLSSILIYPQSASADLGGYAVVHPDGHVCGVIVATSTDPFGNGGTMPQEYMGCPAGSRIIFQTQADPETGNVAGYHGTGSDNNVQYDAPSNTFTISNGPSEAPRISLIIKDGIATDSTGRSFNTGSGLSASTALSQEQFNQLVNETTRVENARTQQGLARTEAQNLAILTPGLERCVSWSGYYESGKECALASSSDTATVQNRSIGSSLTNSETETVLNVISADSGTTVDSVTVKVKPANEFETPTVTFEAVSVSGVISKVSTFLLSLETRTAISSEISKSLMIVDSLRKSTAAKSVNLPNLKISEEKVSSLTPQICVASENKVLRVGKGTCRFTYTAVAESGNQFSIKQSFKFR